jgi:hypothetical protein
VRCLNASLKISNLLLINVKTKVDVTSEHLNCFAGRGLSVLPIQ